MQRFKVNTIEITLGERVKLNATLFIRWWDLLWKFRNLKNMS